MRRIISIPSTIGETLRLHLFQNEIEQGAFLFAQVSQTKDQLLFNVVNVYLVHADGWQVQSEAHLEMKDSERAKIMALARKGNYAAIDCHSHPGSFLMVEFSPSDEFGITEFAAYAKWKLDSKPFAALVWGESSLDGVVWSDDFQTAQKLDYVQFAEPAISKMKPRNSWFAGNSLPWWKRGFNGKRAF